MKNSIYGQTENNKSLKKDGPNPWHKIMSGLKNNQISSTKFQLISCLFTFLSVANQCLYLGQKKKFLMATSWTYELGKKNFLLFSNEQRRENKMQIGITEQTIMAIIIFFSSFFTLLNIWFRNETKRFSSPCGKTLG